jgi:hypothetical protein
MRADGVVAALLPWASPSLFGLVGSTLDSEPLLIISYEWPIPWARVTTPLPKDAIETLQLERFRTDYVFGTGGLPFVQADRGPDPPDFLVSTDGGTEGLECTSFTVSERREALALFSRVRATLLGRPRPEMLHLGGFMIYMWFGGPDVLERPSGTNDDQAADELVQALRDYRPDPERMRISSGSLPAHAPDPGVVTTTTGVSFYAIPIAIATPSTLLFALQGFEIGLSFATEHTAKSAWQELERLIEGHDKPGVDWLLVSAGAPNARGQLFPSDGAVARFAIEHPLPLAKPRHVKRVTIHFWDSGEAWDVFPRLETLFGPVYQGNVLGHQPLITSTPNENAAQPLARGRRTVRGVRAGRASSGGPATW